MFELFSLFLLSENISFLCLDLKEYEMMWNEMMKKHK